MHPELTALDITAQPLSGLRLWTPCEYHLLEILTSGPYLLTQRQLAESSIAGLFVARAIRKALQRLQEQGWLQPHGLRTCLAPLQKHPLLLCEAGTECPDLRELQAIARRRELDSQVWQSRIVWLPSRRTSGLFGSPWYSAGSTQTQALHFALSELVAREDGSRSSTDPVWIWDPRPAFRPYERVLGIRRTTCDGSIHAAGVVSAQSLKSLQLLHTFAAKQDWTLELW